MWRGRTRGGRHGMEFYLLGGAKLGRKNEIRNFVPPQSFRFLYTLSVKLKSASWEKDEMRLTCRCLQITSPTLSVRASQSDINCLYAFRLSYAFHCHSYSRSTRERSRTALAENLCDLLDSIFLSKLLTNAIGTCHEQFSSLDPRETITRDFVCLMKSSGKLQNFLFGSFRLRSVVLT